MMGDGRKNEWTQKEIDDQLTAAYGAAKADIATEFKQAFPRKKVQDVLYFASGSRPTVKNLLNRKLEKTKVPVYNYLFAWEYPINGGITSFHCAELAFCFHALSVPQIKTATGGGAVALALQDKVSQAWINFAKTGIRTSRGSSGSPTRRTTRRRWCSTPPVSRSRSATTSWCRCCRHRPHPVRRPVEAAGGVVVSDQLASAYNGTGAPQGAPVLVSPEAAGTRRRARDLPGQTAHGCKRGDTSRPACGNVGRHERRDDHHSWRDAECQRIETVNLEEQALDGSAGEGGTHQAQAEADQRQSAALPDEHRDHPVG